MRGYSFWNQAGRFPTIYDASSYIYEVFRIHARTWSYSSIAPRRKNYLKTLVSFHKGFLHRWYCIIAGAVQVIDCCPCRPLDWGSGMLQEPSKASCWGRWQVSSGHSMAEQNGIGEWGWGRAEGMRGHRVKFCEFSSMWPLSCRETRDYSVFIFLKILFICIF